MFINKLKYAAAVTDALSHHTLKQVLIVGIAAIKGNFGKVNVDVS